MNSLERIKEIKSLVINCGLVSLKAVKYSEEALTHLNALEQEIKASNDLNLVYMKGFSDGKAEIENKMKDKVLVPKEPTDVIINAMYEQCDGYNSGYYTELYKAMITAAQEE